VFARDGAHVVCLDVPAQGDALAATANRIGGSTIQLDVTDEDAPDELVGHLRDRHGGVDVVVHNAGVTRDKTLGRMKDEQWDMLLGINLISQERINDKLLEGDTLRPDGRIVTVSSMSGIAGNRGQVNYATSKAGVIGTVDALAPLLAERRSTINAVAPGFIETQMTASMPFATREAGRRMNSLSQGGLPVDVAETIAWFASPASGGVNGNVVRVCGQALLGA
jgi:3-oxoacyl-[acyl-carrier protein] reductase